MAIDKINGTAFTNVANLDGVAKANISKFNGQDVPAAANIVTDSLIMHYDFSNTSCYSGSGTSVNDLVGTHDGTLYNGVGFDSTDGGALVFDGSNDYMLFDMLDIWTYMDDAWTVSVWIKYSGTTGKNIWGIASGDTGAADYFSEAWTLRANSDINNGTRSGYIRVFLRDRGNGSGGNVKTVRASWNAGTNDGDWHNIVYTYNNASTPVLTAYVDGVSKTVSYKERQRLLNVENPAERKPAIGAAHGRDDVISGHIDADFGHFLMYSKVLTSSEVTQNFNATKSRFGL